MIKAERLVVGPLATNCYLIGGGDGCVVIDPGADADKIEAKVESLGAPLLAVLLTHGHYDHVGAAAELKAKYGAKIYMHRADADMIGSRERSLAFLTDARPAPFEPDEFVQDGGSLALGELSFAVAHTPGHSPGGVCYALGAAVFCGDLIFRESIGRFDFGSFEDEMASIRRLLAAYPDETLLLPGHGESTTVGHEKSFNPYLR